MSLIHSVWFLSLACECHISVGTGCLSVTQSGAGDILGTCAGCKKRNSQLRDKREPRQLLGGQYINLDRYCNDMHVFVMCIDTLHTYQDSTELVH